MQHACLTVINAILLVAVACANVQEGVALFN